MTSLPEQIGASWNLFLIFSWRAKVLQDKWEKKTLKQTKKKRSMSTFIQGVCAHSADLFLFFFKYSSQRGRKHNAKLTETAFWHSHVDPDHLLGITSPHVTRTAPMSPCSATAARDSAGVWTATGRRSPGLAPGLAADRCVSQITCVYKKRGEQAASLSLTGKRSAEGSRRRLFTKFLQKKTLILRLSLLGIEHGGVRPPVGPTPRPDVYPLQPGTHLLFAQSGRIEHVPMDGYDMKKADAKPVLHLPVSWRNPYQQLVQICFVMRGCFDRRLFVV